MPSPRVTQFLSSRTMVKAALWLLLPQLVAPAIADEPAWWTQQKKDCGLPASLAYNTWVAQGSPCNRGNNATSAPRPPTKQELEAKDLMEAADDETNKGAECFKKRDWSCAISHFKAALEFVPDHDDATHNLKQALAAAGAELAKKEAEASERERALQADKQQRDQQTLRIAEISNGLRKMNVPPPILAEDATIAFGQLAPEDHKSKNILLGADIGVAAFELKMAIAGQPLNILPAKVIFVVGNTFIAAEDAADVYLVKQSDTYEQSLRYLKDDITRPQFTAIVRAIKEHRPISENASIDMVRTAQAILDPKLGNGGNRLLWDAMLSPEARHAALTRFCIELGGEIIGKSAEKVVSRIAAERLPAFTKSTESLSEATAMLKRTKDPAARDALNEVIKLANERIAESYHAVEPVGKAMGNFYSMFAKHEAENVTEKK